MKCTTHCQQGRADGHPAHLPEQPWGEAQHGFHVMGEPLDPCGAHSRHGARQLQPVGSGLIWFPGPIPLLDPILVPLLP